VVLLMVNVARVKALGMVAWDISGYHDTRPLDWASPTANVRPPGHTEGNLHAPLGKRTLAEARELYVYSAYLPHILADLAYDLGWTLTARTFAIDSCQLAHEGRAR